MADRPQPRSRTITAVMWTQYVTAASVVLTAVGLLIVGDSVRTEAVRQIGNHPELQTDAGVVIGEIDWVVQASFGVMAVFYLIVAAFYVTLALLNRKDGETGRILTWYLAGAGILCCAPGSLIARLTDYGAGRSMIPQDSGGLDYRSEANDFVLESTPALVTALDWLSVLLLTGGSLLILILLTIRAAKERFRRNESLMPPEESS